MENKKIKKLVEYNDDVAMAFYNRLVELTEMIEEANEILSAFDGIDVKSLENLKGDDGYTPVKGKDYFTEDEIRRFLKYVTPIKGEHYFDGKDGKDGVNGKDAIETPKSIKQKLESLLEDERLTVKSILGAISKKEFEEAIKELRKEIIGKVDGTKQELVTSINKKEKIIYPTKGFLDQRWHGAGSGTTVSYADLSSQCDGNTKTFTIPAFKKIIQLTFSSSPFVFRPTIDFTASGTTLTLDASIAAPEAGQTLILLYA